MEASIPEEWKRGVCAVLKTEKDIDVKFTSALQPWNDAFPNDTRFDLYDTLREALSIALVRGRHVEDMKEPGETWTFKFCRDARQFFGKICLCPGGKAIIVYSAHICRKGDQL